jgi:hypothetical protein
MMFLKARKGKQHNGVIMAFLQRHLHAHQIDVIDKHMNPRMLIVQFVSVYGIDR